MLRDPVDRFASGRAREDRLARERGEPGISPALVEDQRAAGSTPPRCSRCWRRSGASTCSCCSTSAVAPTTAASRADLRVPRPRPGSAPRAAAPARAAAARMPRLERERLGREYPEPPPPAEIPPKINPPLSPPKTTCSRRRPPPDNIAPERHAEAPRPPPSPPPPPGSLRQDDADARDRRRADRGLGVVEVLGRPPALRRCVACRPPRASGSAT